MGCQASFYQHILFYITVFQWLFIWLFGLNDYLLMYHHPFNLLSNLSSMKFKGFVLFTCEKKVLFNSGYRLESLGEL